MKPTITVNGLRLREITSEFFFIFYIILLLLFFCYIVVFSCGQIWACVDTQECLGIISFIMYLVSVLYLFLSCLLDLYMQINLIFSPFENLVMIRQMIGTVSIWKLVVSLLEKLIFNTVAEILNISSPLTSMFRRRIKLRNCCLWFRTGTDRKLE